MPLVEAGPLPAAEAGALFADSMAGYFTYPIAFLAKSSIFGGYCSYGMLPVTFAENTGENRDGLRAGVHYVAGVGDVSADALESVARAAHAWYWSHRLEVHAASIRRQMEG